MIKTEITSNLTYILESIFKISYYSAKSLSTAKKYTNNILTFSRKEKSTREVTFHVDYFYNIIALRVRSICCVVINLLEKKTMFSP